MAKKTSSYTAYSAAYVQARFKKNSKKISIFTKI
jgi:hypothetical protein